MSTASTFHSAALARAMRHAGDTFAFGGVEFLGFRSKLKADDPRLPGAGDRAILVTAEASRLPAVLPTTGAILSTAAGLFRLVRPVDLQPDGSAQILVVPHLAA